MNEGRRAPRCLLPWTLTSALLLTSCALAPQGPPEVQLALPLLPDLEPEAGALEPDYTLTMRCFLRGRLTSGSGPDCSGTPATLPTGAPKKR